MSEIQIDKPSLIPARATPELSSFRAKPELTPARTARELTSTREEQEPPRLTRTFRGGREEAFSDTLAAARNAFPGETIETLEDAIRKSANEMIAKAFFEPLFELMRNDPLRAEVTPISAGEKMFGPLLDTELSKRITQAENFPLADALVRQLLPSHLQRNDAQGLRAVVKMSRRNRRT